MYLIVSDITVNFHDNGMRKYFCQKYDLRYYFMSSVRQCVHFYQGCVLQRPFISNDRYRRREPEVESDSGFILRHAEA